MEKPELYFPRDIDWRDWLHENHQRYTQGVYLIFYKLEVNMPTMRWEEAVRVALCYGWIDSTVKSLGNGKRQQYFCPRNPKSHWSALNKRYISEMEKEGLIHESGWKMITQAKKIGTWTAMDHVENLVVPKDLQNAFKENKLAYTNFKKFTPGYQKGYLSWLFQAKREETRVKRIKEIVRYCEQNIKIRQ
ncbi:MAG: YdeI/OmpD-associated family protein [Flavobacteriaceae bacterium]